MTHESDSWESRPFNWGRLHRFAASDSVLRRVRAIQVGAVYLEVSLKALGVIDSRRTLLPSIRVVCDGLRYPVADARQVIRAVRLRNKVIHGDIWSPPRYATSRAIVAMEHFHAFVEAWTSARSPQALVELVDTAAPRRARQQPVHLSVALDDDRYIIEGEVGRGGMQEVYRALDDKLQRQVALKVPQDAKVARRFRESAVISAKVNHPNVAKTLDYFEDGNGRFYLVEELVDGPNLRRIATRFQRFDPHAVAHVLHHLARGVAASHRVGVVHRDLKPSNILVANGLAFRAVKVTDFGIAKMAEKEIGDAVSGGDETTQSSAPATATPPNAVWLWHDGPERTIACGGRWLDGP